MAVGDREGNRLPASGKRSEKPSKASGSAPLALATDRRQLILGGAAAALGGTAAVAACQDAPSPPPNAFSVKAAGAVGDGRADDSAAVQSAYDRLARQGGGILFFPRGTYRIGLQMTSRLVHIHGEGRSISVLVPAAPDGTVLRALYADAGWEAASISNLSVRGARPLRGTGLVYGHSSYQRNDEYTGRTRLTAVGFDNLDRCIVRPLGNIGLWIDGCTFTNANYHIWTRSHTPPPGDAMHGGNLIVSKSRFTGFGKAMLFLDCPNTVGGQVTFQDNIFENAQGFVIYIRAFNGAGAAPGITFQRNWNEATASGQSIEVEGQIHHRASFLWARDNNGLILFEDTPVGTMELLNAQVETRDCALDNLTAVRADARSTLVHHRARYFTGLAPGLCYSISGPTVSAGLRTPWFRMPAPSGETLAYAGAVLQRFDGQVPISFTGSASVATEFGERDAALPGQRASQRLTITGGQSLWPAPGFDAPARSWLATAYIYRLLGGDAFTLQLTGPAGISGMVSCESRKWEMLVNVTEHPGQPIAGLGLWHRSNGAHSVIRIGGVAILAFQTRQEAMEFVNSRLFPA